MPDPDFTRSMRDHLRAAPRAAPPVTPADLDRSHEATSADGRVSASVNGLTLALESVAIHHGDAPEAVADAAVEAINAALAAAESGPSRGGLEEAVAARVSEMDEQMDRISGRLDEISARMDQLLGG